MTSQNIYDQADFFANYASLDRSVHGLAGAPEWPRLRSLLPDLTGRRVFDLGCGFGWFCRWARTPTSEGGGGAAAVHGIDLSSNMLERARRMTEESGLDGGLTYEQADLDTLQLPEAEVFDVVFSSLALHYLVHLPELVRRVHGALKPSGAFVFSVEHPIFTAPSRPGVVKVPARAGKGKEGDGEVADGKEWRYWPLDDYQREGLRVTDWLAEGVRKQHRTASTYIGILLEAGFELTAYDEWFPKNGELADQKEWEANEMVKPTFLLVRGVKKTA